MYMEFRAKSKETKDWVIGNGVFVGPYEFTIVFNNCAYQTKEEGEHSYIFSSFGEKELVIKDTIGRYTGYIDNNHVKAYEGDIVQIKHRKNEITSEVGVIKFGEYHPFNNLKEYNQSPSHLGYYISVKKVLCSPLSITEVPVNKQVSLSFIDVVNNGEIKVIGNIFDNPELLELNER